MIMLVECVYIKNMINSKIMSDHSGKHIHGRARPVGTTIEHFPLVPLSHQVFSE